MAGSSFLRMSEIEGGRKHSRWSSRGSRCAEKLSSMRTKTQTRGRMGIRRSAAIPPKGPCPGSQPAPAQARARAFAQQHRAIRYGAPRGNDASGYGGPRAPHMVRRNARGELATLASVVSGEPERRLCCELGRETTNGLSARISHAAEAIRQNAIADASDSTRTTPRCRIWPASTNALQSMTTAPRRNAPQPAWPLRRNQPGCLKNVSALPRQSHFAGLSDPWQR